MFIDNILGIAYAMGTSPQGGAGQGPVGMIGSLIPLVLIFVIFYFLLIRPQQKKAKEHKAMLESLKKGEKIVTSGGIYGVIDPRVKPEDDKPLLYGQTLDSYNLNLREYLSDFKFQIFLASI